MSLSSRADALDALAETRAIVTHDLAERIFEEMLKPVNADDETLEAIGRIADESNESQMASMIAAIVMASSASRNDSLIEAALGLSGFIREKMWHIAFARASQQIDEGLKND